jgi:hypothetical protein
LLTQGATHDNVSGFVEGNATVHFGRTTAMPAEVRTAAARQ